jgi:hypothetical protein
MSTLKSSNADLILQADTGQKTVINSNGANTAITVDSSQNVGVGVASPTQKLDVNGTVKATSFSGSGSALTGVSDPTWDGGATGLTAATGRTSLGLVIGTNVQAFDATIMVGADIGSTVQAYDADTAKTDAAQTFTASQRGEITTLTSATTVTPDFADSNNFTLTLGHNVTLANPTNLTAGQSGSIFAVQDGTGSRTMAFGSYWDFAGGTAPTMTTTASGIDRIDYCVRTTTSIHAVVTLALS